MSLSIDPAVISELLLAHPEIAYRGPKQSALVTADVPNDLYDPVIRLLGLQVFGAGSGSREKAVPFG